jgi:hypothetical protein
VRSAHGDRLDNIVGNAVTVWFDEILVEKTIRVSTGSNNSECPEEHIERRNFASESWLGDG